MSIGPSWSAVTGWRRTRPDQPFVGIRVQHDDVWVACVPLIAGQPIPAGVRADLERLFNQAGREVWIDAQVFLFRAANLREARRVARQAVAILRRHGRRPVEPTSSDETTTASGSGDRK
jgi:hypothetical protein